MEYSFLANIQREFTLQKKGIRSHVLHEDDNVNVSLFSRRPSSLRKACAASWVSGRSSWNSCGRVHDLACGDGVRS